MEEQLDTLDLSGRKIKKLSKPQPGEAHVTVLILDDNELQRLDNIDSFTKVQKLSVVRNQLLRMYGVCRLHLLHTLNLAHNGILTIEGLKDLVNLKCLCLAGNDIKTIEHLNTNVNLEHLDLSENNITHIADLSFLKNLKELLLHGNRISHLRNCDRYLPASLITFTLASNNIADLNEISQLVNLVNLNNFSIANNPCVNMTGNNIGFDYRPFLINWCMNLKVIDGYVVDAIESLRAEWLYSQGRGRHFRAGDHHELTQYLASCCPLTGETLETEEDRKLRLILSKAQHHQQQLRDQLTSNGVETPTPSPATRRKIKNSPRLNNSRNNRVKSPDRMTASFYNVNTPTRNNSLMSQSLDPTLLSQNIAKTEEASEPASEVCPDNDNPNNCPLQAATKLVPVPESLMSPDFRPSNSLVNRLTRSVAARPHSAKKEVRHSPKLGRQVNQRQYIGVENKKNTPSPVRQRKTSTPVPDAVIGKSSSSEEESEVCTSKLQTIQTKVQEHKMKNESLQENKGKTEVAAAVYIQKMWRGYYTRNKDKKTLDLLKQLQTQRTQQYIQQLSNDMESTKAALESERKIQVLQMQAINALWKKVSNIQPSEKGDCSGMGPAMPDNAEVVKELAQTCSMLHSQVQQLQGSMQDVMKCMAAFCQLPGVSQQLRENAIATQTEIVAVHTPQGEAGKNFPFQKTPRPSSLPLPVAQRGKHHSSQTNASQEVKQFARNLVDGVIKTVSESAECADVTEIRVTDTDGQSSSAPEDLSESNEPVSETDTEKNE